MKPFILSLILTTLTFGSVAQNENQTGAKSYGLAGNSILFQDVWSTNNNPAGLGKLQSWNAGFSFENQFLLEELSSKTAVITIPVSIGSFGLSVYQFGFNNYNENRVGLSFGQQLGEKLNLGIQLNYLITQLGNNYGSRSALSGNIGLLSNLTNELTLAVVIINLNRTKLSDFIDERYPTLLKMGLGYQFSNKVNLITEIVKDIDFESNIRVGIEYNFISKLYLRTGYATSPALSSFGFGIDIRYFRLELASGFDSNFGFSPQVSLSYSPKKTE